MCIIRPLDKLNISHYQYLSENTERAHKREVSIICSSHLSYSECLAKFGLDTLFARRVALCSKLFNSTTSSPGHRLIPLLPPSNPQQYNLGRQRAYATPHANTDHKDIHLSIACVRKVPKCVSLLVHRITI